MRNFKLFSILAVSFLVIRIFYSCTNDPEIENYNSLNQTVQSRSVGCPELNLELITVPGTPCAHVKLVYNGTKDPNSTCILKGYEIKVYKAWDPNVIRNFITPIFNSPPGTRYPLNSNWVSTLSGEVVNLGGPSLGTFTVIANNANVNDKFEYFIPSSVDLGSTTWVCVAVHMTCNGEECSDGNCAVQHTPCI